jgi:cysteine synthase
MKNPAVIPANIHIELSKIGLWDIKPLNLFHITWRSEPVPEGGGFRGLNLNEFISDFWRWIYAD